MKRKTPRTFIVILPVLTGILVSICVGKIAYAYHPFGSKALKLALTGNAGGFFDDNITLSRKSKKSDWVTDLICGFWASYSGKKHTWDLVANDREQIYSRHSEFTNNSQDVRMNYQYERTQHDRIGLKSTFRHYYSPVEFEDAFGRTGGQFNFLTSQTDLTYTRDVSRQLSLSATAGGGVNILEKQAGRDSYETRAGASGVYSLSTKWSLLGAYDFSMRTIKNGPRATIHAITGGTRFYFTDRLFWDGIAGIQVADNFSHEILVRPYIQTSLNGELDKKTTGRILFSQRSETTSYSSNLFDQWRISIDLARVLRDRLRAFVVGFYGRGEYQSVNIKDNLFGINGGLTYELNKYFKVVASYSFSTVGSNQKSRDYTKNVAAAKIAFTF